MQKAATITPKVKWLHFAILSSWWYAKFYGPLFTRSRAFGYDVHDQRKKSSHVVVGWVWFLVFCGVLQMVLWIVVTVTGIRPGPNYTYVWIRRYLLYHIDVRISFQHKCNHLIPTPSIHPKLNQAVPTVAVGAKALALFAPVDKVWHKVDKTDFESDVNMCQNSTDLEGNWWNKWRWMFPNNPAKLLIHDEVVVVWYGIMI